MRDNRAALYPLLLRLTSSQLRNLDLDLVELPDGFLRDFLSLEGERVHKARDKHDYIASIARLLAEIIAARGGTDEAKAHENLVRSYLASVQGLTKGITMNIPGVTRQTRVITAATGSMELAASIGMQLPERLAIDWAPEDEFLRILEDELRDVFSPLQDPAVLAPVASALWDIEIPLCKAFNRAKGRRVRHPSHMRQYQLVATALANGLWRSKYAVVRSDEQEVDFGGGQTEARVSADLRALSTMLGWLRAHQRAQAAEEEGDPDANCTFIVTLSLAAQACQEVHRFVPPRGGKYDSFALPSDIPVLGALMQEALGMTEQLLALYEPAISVLRRHFEELTREVDMAAATVLDNFSRQGPAQQLSDHQIVDLQSHVEPTVKGWRDLANIPSAQLHEHIAELHEHLDRTVIALKEERRALFELGAVVSWLRGLRFRSALGEDTEDVQEVEEIAPEHLTLIDVRKAVQDRRKQIMGGPQQGREDDTLRKLCFLVSRNSELFKKYVREYLHENSIQVGFRSSANLYSTLQRATRAAVQNLERWVISDDLTLDQISRSETMAAAPFQNLRSHRKHLLQQFRTVTDFFIRFSPALTTAGTLPTGSLTVGTLQRLHQNPDHAIQSRNLEHHLNRLNQTVVLLNFQEHLESAVEVLESRCRVVRAEARFGALCMLEQRIRDTRTIRLSEVEGLIDELRGCAHSTSPIVFIQSQPDFNGQLGLLTADHQGNEVNQQILTELAVAKENLSALLGENFGVGQGPADSVPLEAVLARLLGRSGSEEDAREFINVLESAVSHLEDLKRWFSGDGAAAGADKIVKNVSRYLQQGTFRGSTTRGLELWTDPEGKRRLSSEKLLEEVKGAVLVKDEDRIGEEERAALIHFVRAYDLAVRCCSLIVKAEEEGLPQYQGLECALGVRDDTSQPSDAQAGIRIDELQTHKNWVVFDRAYWMLHLTHVLREGMESSALCRMVQERAQNLGIDLRPWQGDSYLLSLDGTQSEVRVSAALLPTDGEPAGNSQSQKRLAFLDDIQRLKLIRHIEEANLEPLIAQMILCFPDAVQQTDKERADDRAEAERREYRYPWCLPRIFRMAAVLRTFLEDQLNTWAARAGTSGIEALLCCVEIVRGCDRVLEEQGLVKPFDQLVENCRLQEPGAEQQAVVISPPQAGAEGPVFTEAIHHAFCNEECFAYTLPWPNQVLWCSNDVSKSVMRTFLERIRCLPHVPYAIVGFEALRVRVRENLLRSLVDVDDDTQLQLGKSLALVQTRIGDGDRFDFLVQESSREVPRDICQKFVVAQSPADLFGNITVVVGRARDGKTSLIQQMIAEELADSSLKFALAVHEGFTPEKVMKEYRACSDRQDRQDEPVSFFFNVLADADDGPDDGQRAERRGQHLHRLSHFLYHMRVHGLLLDTATGDTLLLNPSRKHHIFVELPALDDLPTDEPGRPLRAEDHPYIKFLPILSYAPHTFRVASVDDSPFILSEESHLVALYLSINFAAFREGLLPDSTNEDRNLAFEAGPVLEQFWQSDLCRSLPRRHGVRAAVIKLLADRVRFLQRLDVAYTEACRQPHGRGISREEANVLFGEGGLKDHLRRIFENFKREAVMLCDGSLQGDWSATRCTFSVRPDTEGLDCFSDLRFLSPMSQNSDEGWEFANRVKGVLSGEEISRDMGMLRASIAPAFGLRDSGRFLTLVINLQYCLTPDFGVKLLVLNDMMRTRQSIVLEGETGTGKTEILSLFATISQHSSRVADMATELFNVIQQLVDDGTLSPRDRKLRPLFAESDVEAAAGKLKPTKELVEAVEQMLRDENRTLLRCLALPLLDHFTSVFKQTGMQQKPTVQADLQRHQLWSWVVGKAANRGILPAGADGRCEEEDDGTDWESQAPSEVGSMADLEMNREAVRVNARFEGTRQDIFLQTTERDTFHVFQVRPELLRDPNRPAGVVSAEDLEGQTAAVTVRPALDSCAYAVSFIRDCLQSVPRNAFFRIRMHEGVTASLWRDKVNEIAQAAMSSEDIVVVAFVDELNTTQVMGMVQEVFSNNTLDGLPLPENIFWIGAINPAGDRRQQDSRHVIQVGELQQRGAPAAAAAAAAIPAEGEQPVDVGNYMGTTDEADEEVYIVRQMPPSLQQCVLQIAGLGSSQERDFLRALFKDINLGMSAGFNNDEHTVLLLDALQNAILCCQEFVRSLRLHRVEVSIRDMMRAVMLYRLFSGPRHCSFFLHDVSLPPKELERYTRSQAMCMALFLTHVVRLPSSGSDSRSNLFRELTELFAAEPATRPFVDNMRPQAVVKLALEHVWKRTAIPAGIASTNALQEILYACVAGVEASLPVLVTGPAGIGKTLGAATLTFENMQGRSSPSQEYKTLKYTQRFTYQCSEASTTSEIKQVYEAAEERHHRFLQNGIHSERVAVFLDEASLPRERRAALKVTHYYLDRSEGSDRPNVATIMLTNRTLDAAKTNRTFQVLQSEASSQDLLALAQGCLLSRLDMVRAQMGDDQTIRDRKKRLAQQIEGLCNAYLRSNGLCGTKMFHLRDFIYLLRMLRRQVIQRDDAEEEDGPRLQEIPEIEKRQLLRALRRNFNGIPPEKFAILAHSWLVHCQLAEEGDFDPQDPALQPRVIETLRLALNDTLPPDIEPNHCPFRHVLLIDHTASECGLELLCDQGILDRSRAEFVAVSDFPEDATALFRSQLTARVKTAIEDGRTGVLINASPLYSSLFDVLNIHYSSVTMNEGSAAGPSLRQRKVYIARIGIGAQTRPCRVNPQFRLVVHQPSSQMTTTQLPFLNRFEKYEVRVQDILKERLAALHRAELQPAGGALAPAPSIEESHTLASLFYNIYEGAEDFMAFLGRSTFYGAVPGETTAAVVLQAMAATKSHGDSVPIMRKSFPVHTDGRKRTNADLSVVGEEADEEDSPDAPSGNMETAVIRPRSEDRVRYLRHFIRQANFQLLQIARPEEVFLRRAQLPESYLREFLGRQEHFTGAMFIRQLTAAHFTQEERGGRLESPWGDKWVMYCRGSGELQHVCSSAHRAPRPGEPSLWHLIPSYVSVQESLLVIALSSIKSADELEGKVIEFFHVANQRRAPEREEVRRRHDSSHRKLLLVFADMQSLTISQVNYAMRTIGSLQCRMTTNRPLAIVVQHFPAERLHFGACFDSVPVGWQFYYADSFGIRAAQAAAEQGIIEEEPTVRAAAAAAGAGTDDNDTPAVGDRGLKDPRMWMQVAFGLESSPPEDVVVAEFRDKLLDELKQAIGIMGFAVDAPDPQERFRRLGGIGLSPQLRMVYAEVDRTRMVVQQLFAERPYLVESVLGTLAAEWGRSLVKSVEEASLALSEGRSVEGLLEYTRGTMKGLLSAAARELLSNCAADFGLEALIQLPRQTETRDDARTRFTVLLLRSFPPLTASQVRELSDIRNPTVPVSNAVSRVPKTPLYSYLLNRLSLMVAKVSCGCAWKGVAQTQRLKNPKGSSPEWQKAFGERVGPSSRLLGCFRKVSERGSLRLCGMTSLRISCFALNSTDRVWGPKEGCTEDELEVLRWTQDLHLQTGGENLGALSLISLEILRPTLGDIMAVMAPLRHFSRQEGEGDEEEGNDDTTNRPVTSPYQRLLSRHTGQLGFEGPNLRPVAAAAAAAAAAGGDPGPQESTRVVGHRVRGAIDSVDSLLGHLGEIVTDILWEKLQALSNMVRRGQQVDESKVRRHVGKWLRAVRDLAPRFHHTLRMCRRNQKAVHRLGVIATTRAVLLRCQEDAATIAAVLRSLDSYRLLESNGRSSGLEALLDGLAVTAAQVAPLGCLPDWCPGVTEEVICLFTSSIGWSVVEKRRRTADPNEATAAGGEPIPRLNEAEVQTLPVVLLSAPDVAFLVRSLFPRHSSPSTALIFHLPRRVKVALLMDLLTLQRAQQVVSAGLRPLLQEILQAEAEGAGLGWLHPGAEQSFIPRIAACAQKALFTALADSGVLEGDSNHFGVPPPAPEGDGPPNGANSDKLSELLFSAMFEQLSGQNLPIDDLAVGYAELRRSSAQPHHPERRLFSVELAAQVCVFLQTIAEKLSLNRTALDRVLRHANLVTECFRISPAFHCLFLASFTAESARTWFLSDENRLRMFDIPGHWLVEAPTPQEGRENGAAAAAAGGSQDATEEIYSLFPFVAASERLDLASSGLVPPALQTAYDQLAQLMRTPDRVDRASLQRVLDQRELTFGQRRMLLLLATYHCCFCKGRRCPAVREFVRHRDGRNTLKLQQEEAICFEKIADGPHDERCQEHDGMVYLFSKAQIADARRAGTLPERMRRRTAAVNALALILGCSHRNLYYYTCCFRTENIGLTFGLGSGYVDLAKDCGYQTDFDPHTGRLGFLDPAPVRVLPIPPFNGVRRFRALNNYLIWCAFSWGAWFFWPQKTRAFKYLTTHPEDSQGQGMNEKQAYCNDMYVRAHSFLRILEEDESLTGAGIDQTMYMSASIFRTAVELEKEGRENESFPLFPHAHREDSVAKQMTTKLFLMNTCWCPVFQEGQDWREFYLRAANKGFQLNVLCRGLEALQTAIRERGFLSSDAALEAVQKSGSQATAAAADGPTSMLTSAATLVFLLDNERFNLAMGKYVGLLVFFYNWLHEKLAYRLSLNEAMNTTVRQAIDDLPSEQDRYEGRALFGVNRPGERTGFLGAWEDMRRTFVVFQICPQGNEVERPIPELDSEGLTVFWMVTQRGEDDVVDHISRMLGMRLLLQQNNLLSGVKDSGQHLKNLLSAPGFNPFEAFVTQARFEIRKFIRVHASEQQENGTLSESVDVLAAARFAISKYIAGRLKLSSTSLVRRFPYRLDFRTVREAQYEAEADPDSPVEGAIPYSRSGSGSSTGRRGSLGEPAPRLIEAARLLRVQLGVAENADHLSTQEERGIEESLRGDGCHEVARAAVRELSDVCQQVLHHLQQQQQHINEGETEEHTDGHAAPAAAAASAAPFGVGCREPSQGERRIIEVSKIEIARLPAVAEFVGGFYDRQEYLFGHLSAEPCQDFSAETEEALLNAGVALLNGNAAVLRKHHDKLCALAQALVHRQVQPALLQGLPGAPLYTCGQLIQHLTGSTSPRDFKVFLQEIHLEELCSDRVQMRHLKALLRRMNTLCVEVSKSLKTEEALAASANRDAAGQQGGRTPQYEEKVTNTGLRRAALDPDEETAQPRRIAAAPVPPSRVPQTPIEEPSRAEGVLEVSAATPRRPQDPDTSRLSPLPPAVAAGEGVRAEGNGGPAAAAMPVAGAAATAAVAAAGTGVTEGAGAPAAPPIAVAPGAAGAGHAAPQTTWDERLELSGDLIRLARFAKESCVTEEVAQLLFHSDLFEVTETSLKVKNGILAPGILKGQLLVPLSEAKEMLSLLTEDEALAALRTLPAPDHLLNLIDIKVDDERHVPHRLIVQAHAAAQAVAEANANARDALTSASALTFEEVAERLGMTADDLQWLVNERVIRFEGGQRDFLFPPDIAEKIEGELDRKGVLCPIASAAQGHGIDWDEDELEQAPQLARGRNLTVLYRKKEAVLVRREFVQLVRDEGGNVPEAVSDTDDFIVVPSNSGLTLPTTATPQTGSEQKAGPSSGTAVKEGEREGAKGSRDTVGAGTAVNEGEGGKGSEQEIGAGTAVKEVEREGAKGSRDTVGAGTAVNEGKRGKGSEQGVSAGAAGNREGGSFAAVPSAQSTSAQGSALLTWKEVAERVGIKPSALHLLCLRINRGIFAAFGRKGPLAKYRPEDVDQLECELDDRSEGSALIYDPALISQATNTTVRKRVIAGVDTDFVLRTDLNNNRLQ
uniref:Uncharacterized protein n=1 Tax=Chromera velia CCMP2878 TaxID=1169474 RepID=A0A0G4IBB0_9ALVE|eukprot:Cvel_12810.t1-p1 / transcript=Cvel_12810.t1 / gene=Cvel_12810 / organism=Chromera_velia_CCMP2878 / gene_product=Putative uncharacterized transmembrane protein, putative / transcript_product=Putative uncharacterized transmembrane protein, putative / location=Cvel_scaffold853:43203-65425(+) / protein_length=5753 / sequence_SO=supercontig / SO=protein_coding / is_pseudo=false